MIICLIVEGSYPYITGGVSNWVQMLVTQMPEHQFIIYSIAAEEKQRGLFKYRLPDNLIDIQEVFLDSILKVRDSAIGHFPLKNSEINNLTALICGEENIDLECLFNTFRQDQKSAVDIFMSFEFFDVIKQAYQKKFSMLPFTDFFWTVRSMLLPLFYILQQDLPKADLYHSVATGYAGVCGSLAATVYNKPFILTEHGIYSREREEEIIKSNWAKAEFKDLWITYFYSLSKLAYNKANRVYSLFNKNAQLQEFLGCNPFKIKIIPNGVDVEKYSSIQCKADNQYLTIGAIVRIVPIKDILMMIRSFDLIKRKISNACFYIIGPTDEDPEYYKECLDLVSALQLTGVQFTGSVDIKEYLGRIDILVLSSISEGQPLAVLEGLANKKPYVCTDVGSCREILYGNDDKLGSAGRIVAPMDFEEMAKAVIEIASDENLRKQMGENGYMRVAKYYTQQGFIDSYKKVYVGLG